jgi:hypothetical protein
MKKNKKKNEFLEQLKKIPIVQVACEKAGLSRNSVYRWRKEDPLFSTAMDEAIKEGEDLVNDMSENQLLSMIKDKEWSAVSFWLRHRNPRFKDKIEVSGKVFTQTELTEKQKLLLEEGLKRLSQNNEIKDNQEKHGTAI